jgi:hypothetical protein
MSQFAPSELAMNVQSGTHFRIIFGKLGSRRLPRVESAASTNKPSMWIEDSVQKRTDARYGFFYNACLNRKSRARQPAVED